MAPCVRVAISALNDTLFLFQKVFVAYLSTFSRHEESALE
jgi:hypothetical protein